MGWVKPVVDFVTSIASAVVTKIIEHIVTSAMGPITVKIITWAVYVAVTAAVVAVASTFLYMVTGSEFFLDVITAAVAIITVLSIVVGIVSASLMNAAIVFLALVFPLYLLSLLYEGVTGDDSLEQAINNGVEKGIDVTVDAAAKLGDALLKGLGSSKLGSLFKWALVGTGVYILYKQTSKPAKTATTIIQPVGNI